MKQIKIMESIGLLESSEVTSTVNAIRSSIGNPIQILYREIKTTADKYSLNHPDMYNFARIAGSAKSRWLDKFGVRIKADIRKLADIVPPKSARILKDALLERPANYKSFMLVFIPALTEVGRKINSAELVSAAQAWARSEREYKTYVDSLVDEGKSLSNPNLAPAKKDNLTGAQNQQAEALINDVISRLPEKYKHQVRMKVAKSQDKLMTLQQELNNLGIGF